MIAPGMKVAAPVGHGSLALGVVTPDGTSVIWYEIVDHEGRSASAYGGLRMDKRPRPLKGDEVPCPAEFAHFID